MGWFANLFGTKEENEKAPASEAKLMTRLITGVVLAAAALYSAVEITHNQASISRNKAEAAAFMQEETNEKALQILINRMKSELDKTGRVQQDTLGRAKTIADALEREAAATPVTEAHQQELQRAKLSKIGEVRELVRKVEKDNMRRELESENKNFMESSEYQVLKHHILDTNK